MATISNIIQTVFQSSGANNTNRDIDKVNRNMTRLGQSSASAGRSFAAQSQGLGGFVAAYAGAAATTIALQQAFDKLAQSARQTQTLEGLNTLAARSGESSTILLNNVREITKNQLTLAESASQINLSLSAGFDSSQIEGLSQVALKASRALGRDLNDAYTRVVRGSAKMETELLDELGIYTKIDPATRAYAAAIGKTVGQLTEFERRQAFVNAVIEEGNRKYSSINTTLPTSAEQIEAFGTRILDIAGALGRFLADTLAPLADFLTNNLTASFSAFGAIASLVASKGVSVLQNGLDMLTKKIIASGLAAEQNFRVFLGVGKATATASAGIKNYSRELVGVTTKEKELFKTLQEAANTRKLSNKEITQASAILAKNRAEVNRLGQALKDERKDLQASITTRANAIAQAKETQKAAIDNVRALRRQGAATQDIIQAMQVEQQTRIQLANVSRMNTRRLAEERVAYVANRDAINGNISALRALQIAEQGAAKATGLRGQAAGLLSGMYASVAGTLGALGSAFTSVVGKALGVFSIVSLFTLLGSSIADVLGKGEEFDALVSQWGGTIKSLFVDSDAKRISNAIQGITVGVVEELEKTDDELRSIEEFTFTSKVIGLDVEVTKTKADLVREVNQEITGVLNNTAAEADINSWGSIIGGGISVALYAALSAAIPGIGSLLGAGIAAAAGSYIGRIIEDTFAEGELTIGDIKGGQEALDRLKGQYSETFEAAGKELELNIAKGFQNIEERLERQALFDPVARQALQFQKELFAESAKYVNNIESVSQLMTATGKTADVVRKNFTFEQGKTDAEQIVSTLVTLEDKEFNLNFVFLDTLDKELKDFLDNATYTVQVTDFTATKEKASGLLSNLLDPEDITKVLSASTIEGLVLSLKNTGLSYDQFFKGITKAFGASENEITNLSAAFFDSSTTVLRALAEINKVAKDNPIAPLFEEANNAVNNFSTLTARGAENARDLIEQLNSGSIDLETFDQRMKAVTNSTAGSNKAYLDGLAAVSVFADAVSQLDEADQATGIKFLNVMRESLAFARENITTTNELTGALGVQREELEKIAELNQFIAGITKDVKPLNVLDTQAQLGEVGLDDRAKVLSKLVSLTSVIESQGDDVYKRVQAFDALSSKLREAGIAAADMQAIFAMDASNAEQYVNSINDRKDSLASYSEEGKGAFISISKAAVDASGELIAVGEEVTFTLEELGDSGTQLASEAISAMKVLIEGAIAELPKLIDSAINDFRKLSKELTAETENLRNIEIPKLKFEAELDSRQFNFDLAQLQTEGAIAKLELDLDISALKAELGDITPEADVDNQRRINQEILDKREELIIIERDSARADREGRLKLLADENKQNIAAIEARAQQLTSEVNARVAYINTLIGAYDSILQSQESVNNTNLQNAVNTYNAIGKAIYENLKSGGAAINAAIAQALDKDAAGGDVGPVAINAPALQTAEIDFTTAIDSLAASYGEVLTSIESSKQAQLEAQNVAYENATNNIVREGIIEEERANQALNNLSSQRQIEDLNHRARLKDLKDEGSAGGKAADDREKELKEAQKTMDKFYDDVEEGMKKLKKLAADFVSLIFDGLINSKQLEVDADKIGEALTTGVLEYTTQELNSVQSELNEALSEETSLKEELIGLNERLNASQTSYLRAIAEGDLVSASEDYIDSIVEQSRKTIELNRAMRDRSILEGAVQTLEQQQQSAQEAVKLATQERIESERELAELQQITSGIIQLLSTDIFNLGNSLRDLAPALAVLTGQVSGGLPGLQNPVGELTKGIDGILKTVKSARELIKGIGGASEAAKTAADSAATAASSPEVISAAQGAGETAASTFASQAASGLSAALQGAGIGNAIGQILGDDTAASSIGGAIGGAIGSIFGPVGSIVGSILGSLVGSLFGGPKKPEVRAEGVVTSEGYQTTRIRRKDGLSRSEAKKVDDLVGTVFDGLTTNLERIGIGFEDRIRTYVRNTEGEFGNVTTTFASGATFTDKDLGSSTQAAAEALIEQFFKGLTVKRNDEGLVTFRSLVVDALTPNAEDIQTAVDRFAELDISEKTEETFNTFVEFSSKFRDVITELNSLGNSFNANINTVLRGAKANAANISAQYQEFLDQTEEVFGYASEESNDALEAVKNNALAQLNLAEAADGSLVALESLDSAFNAGKLGIIQLVKNLEEFETVLVDIGYNIGEAAKIVNVALDVNLTKTLEDYSKSINDELSALLGPEQLAVNTIAGIEDQGTAVIDTINGLVSGLEDVKADDILALGDAEKLRGISVANANTFEDIIRSAIPNFDSSAETLANSVENGFLDIISEYDSASASLDRNINAVASAQARLKEISQTDYGDEGGQKKNEDRMRAKSAFDDAKDRLDSAQSRFAQASESFASIPQDLVPLIESFSVSGLEEAAQFVRDNLDLTTEQNRELFETPIEQLAPLLLDYLTEFKDFADASTIAESEARNRVDELTNKIDTAVDLLDPAELLRTEKLKAALSELSVVQLEAVIAAEEGIRAKTKELAADRLIIQKQKEAIENTNRYADALKDFNDRIADITGRIAIPSLSTNFTSVADVLNVLGEFDATPFANSFTGLLNSISATSDINGQFNSGLDLLNSTLAKGELTSDQYVESLTLLTDATLTAVERQKELVDAYESTLADIRNLFNQSLDSVQSAIQDLGDTLSELVGSIQDSTATIFGIYDDTLADVASSGNELFDLRDSAREAFKASSDAVKQFEEANSISGKSASQIRQEIDNIQNSINSLLSEGSLDLSSFRQLSELTSGQNSLQRELSNVLRVEEEYANLIGNREQASKDLAFAEAAVLELGDNLIDTRRSESEIIQQVQDATVSFVQSQKDLEEITSILAENNFDLNQIRTSENDRVREVSSAVRTLNSDLDSLKSIIESVLSNSELQSTLEDSAAKLGALIANNLGLEEGSAEWAEIVQNRVAQVSAAFEQGLIPLSNTINSAFDFNIENLTGVSEELQVLETTTSTLTTRFSEFSTDLVRYLDTEGLAQFYGEGGIFSKFRDSLFSTLVTDGFEILTASNGPLEGFQLSFLNIGNTLSELAKIGVSTITDISGASDSIASLVQVIGTGSDGLTTAVNSLFVVGDVTADTVKELNGSIDDLNVNLEEASKLTLAFEPQEINFDNIINSITLFNTDLEALTITSNLEDIVKTIKTQIKTYDSEITDLEVNLADIVADKIITDITTYNSTIRKINVNLGRNTADLIDTDITNYNSTIGSVVLTLGSNTADKITSDVALYNSTAETVTVTLGSNTADKITTDVALYNSTAENVTTTLGSNTADKIIADVALYNSTAETITITLGSNTASKITADVSVYNSTIEVISVDLGSNTADKITSDVALYNSTVEVISVNLGSNVSSLVLSDISAYNSTIEVISVNLGSNTASRITSDISTYNSTIENIKVNLGSDVASLIVSDVGTYNGTIENIKVNLGSDVASLVSTDVKSYNDTLTLLTVDAADLTADKIAADIEKYKTELTEIESIVSAADLAQDLVDDVAAYNTKITSTDFSSLVTVVDDVFDKLMAVFSVEDASAVKTFTDELTSFNNVVQKLVVNDINPLTPSTETLIDTLVSDFREINSAIDSFAPTGIDSLKTVWSTIVRDIQNAWNNIDLSGPSPRVDFSDTVDRAYRTVLGRAPDTDGLNFYKGVLEQNPGFNLERELRNSPENRVIRPAYEELFDRAPNLREINTYKDIIEADPAFNLIEALKQTSEYVNSIAAQTGTSASYDTPDFVENTPTVTTTSSATQPDTAIADRINNAFSSILNRAADNAGFDFYKRILEQNPGFDLENELRNSTEARVISAYNSFSNITPTAQDIKKWTDFLTENPAFNFEDSLRRVAASDMYSSGGYVQGLGTSISDSINARLSNGEFVMQAAAVRKLGVRALDMLNATGDVRSISGEPNFVLNKAPITQVVSGGSSSATTDNSDSEVNVEVNVVNQGTSQQPISEPVVRRENGKIVVDVILEDLRNNGPIKRQIRSIR